MPGPRILHRERQPLMCPECGFHDLGSVRSEDIEVRDRVPTPGEDGELYYPGLVTCRRCGTIVQLGP